MQKSTQIIQNTKKSVSVAQNRNFVSSQYKNQEIIINQNQNIPQKIEYKERGAFKFQEDQKDKFRNYIPQSEKQTEAPIDTEKNQQDPQYMVKKSPFDKRKKTDQELIREKQDQILKENILKNGPLANIPDLKNQHLHKLGFTRQLTYNSKSNSVWPSDLRFAFISFLSIIVPTSLIIAVTIWGCQQKYLDHQYQIILTSFVCITAFMSLWSFYYISFTDPGILPSIEMNTPIIDSEKYRANGYKEYYVEYQKKQEVDDTMDSIKLINPVDKFYSFKKFKYLSIKDSDITAQGAIKIDQKKRHNKLSYCNTCNHLRPPRSFHCSQCGVCIEVHDHHCPWVGTCIGYRNLKYFISFLFWTGFHALLSCVICLSIMVIATNQMNDENYQSFNWITKACFVYALIISFCLLSFCIYQICSLGLNNITSNEDIRHRWNGHKRNFKAVQTYKKQSGCCGRLSYILYGNIDHIHGESKLINYAQMIETYYEIQRIQSNIHQKINLPSNNQQQLKKQEEVNQNDNDERQSLLDPVKEADIQMSQESEELDLQLDQNKKPIYQLQMKLLGLQRKLNNIQILNNYYGIEIDQKDLQTFNIDQDLLDNYFKNQNLETLI